MNNFDSTTSFFYFDANARLIKDSSIYASKGIDPSFSYYTISYERNLYNYSANKLIRSGIDSAIFSSNTTPNTSYFADTATLDANQNVINYVEYSDNNIPFVNHPNITATITYDNNINPLNKLSISKTFFPIPDPIDNSFVYGLRKNNFSTYTRGFSQASTTFTNKYYNNGYIMNTNFVNPCNQTTYGYLFKYKAL